jgi:hypothetical protein
LTARRANFIEKIPYGGLFDYEASPTLGNAHAAIIVDKTLPSDGREQARAFILVRRFRGEARWGRGQFGPTQLKEM